MLVILACDRLVCCGQNLKTEVVHVSKEEKEGSRAGRESERFPVVGRTCKLHSRCSEPQDKTFMWPFKMHTHVESISGPYQLTLISVAAARLTVTSCLPASCSSVVTKGS